MDRPKVKIQYGILTGESRGKRFRKALADAGYVVVRDAAEADVIIGHSAGCFWLPEADESQAYVLIDPPYWPERTIRERGRSRARRNLQFRAFGYPMRYWIARNLWNIYYSVADMKRTRRIIRHAPHFDLPSVLEGRRVTLVRNDHDDWLTPDLDDLAQHHPRLQVVRLPGDHDDCLYDPKPYVHLIGGLLQRSEIPRK